MDARIRYTKKIIRETFVSLLGQMPISKITVKEICEKAEINRATFYKYYDNPYDLMDKIEKETLDSLEARINSRASDSLVDIFRIVLTDISEQSSLYMTLFSENGDEMFKKRLFSYCYQDNIITILNAFPDMPKHRQDWLYYFIAEGCNGVLNKWLEGNMAEDIEDVVTFLNEMIDAINGLKFRFNI